MRILISCLYPPIPIRTCDYCAWVDGNEEGIRGFGPTAASALLDLAEQMLDKEDSECTTYLNVRQS